MIRMPSSVMVAGPSGSGKTQLVEDLLTQQRVFQFSPTRIVYCYGVWQPRFARMKKNGIHFHEGIPDPEQLTTWFRGHKMGVMILDDLMEEGGNDKRVLDLFTKDSHHRNITVFYLTQDLFPPWQVCQNHQSQSAIRHCVQKPPRSHGDAKSGVASVSRAMEKSHGSV